MITPLLTLHTATTAVLVLVQSTLNNTTLPQQINLQHSHNKRLHPKKFNDNLVCTVKLLILDEKIIKQPRRLRGIIRSSSGISDSGLSTVNVFLIIKPHDFCIKQTFFFPPPSHLGLNLVYFASCGSENSPSSGVPSLDLCFQSTDHSFTVRCANFLFYFIFLFFPTLHQ